MVIEDVRSVAVTIHDDGNVDQVANCNEYNDKDIVVWCNAAPAVRVKSTSECNLQNQVNPVDRSQDNLNCSETPSRYYAHRNDVAAGRPICIGCGDNDDVEATLAPLAISRRIKEERLQERLLERREKFRHHERANCRHRNACRKPLEEQQTEKQQKQGTKDDNDGQQSQQQKQPTDTHIERYSDTQVDNKFNSKIHCVGGGKQTDGVYYCSLCDYQNKLYTSIRDHYYRLHAASPSSLRCSVCSKMFLRTERLRDHMRSKHTGEKPYACAFCDRSFASTAARAMHMKSSHRRQQSCRERAQ